MPVPVRREKRRTIRRLGKRRKQGHLIILPSPVFYPPSKVPHEQVTQFAIYKSGRKIKSGFDRRISAERRTGEERRKTDK